MKKYQTPEIVDYGSLAELTESNGATSFEDGLGKAIHPDGSQPMH